MILIRQVERQTAKAASPLKTLAKGLRHSGPLGPGGPTQDPSVNTIRTALGKLRMLLEKLTITFDGAVRQDTRVTHGKGRRQSITRHTKSLSTRPTYLMNDNPSIFIKGVRYSLHHDKEGTRIIINDVAYPLDEGINWILSRK